MEIFKNGVKELPYVYFTFQDNIRGKHYSISSKMEEAVGILYS